MLVTEKVTILGAPLDLGQERRGVDMGPSAIRYSGLADRLSGLGVEVYDAGDCRHEIPEIAAVDDEQARYLPAILVSTAQVARQVSAEAAAGRMPIVLGGDHSVAMGTLAGLHSVHGRGGLLWIDAHGDLNTPETSPSGNVHGMPLAAALGRAGFEIEDFEPPPWVDPHRVALVGIRSLDPGEKSVIRDLGLHPFTMSEVDRRGIGAVMQEAIEIIAGDGFVHLSLDMDACDPEIAPGVGTPVKGGLSYREAHAAMELLAEARVLTSIEVVEVNPILDVRNATGDLAVDLVASALGARIL
ncbi:MAG TPA: arginase [Actinomycetota bacterium]|jgi:arginase|nr:arginase [Actinomycetota bacterium]